MRSFVYLAICITPIIAGPIGFNVTNLASDIPGAAAVTDPGLINPWGLSASGSSPFWLSINGSGTSELYNGAGVKQALTVTIPGTGGNGGTPTGTVFNGTTNFNSDLFLFASEDGNISGWRGALGTTAEVLQSSSSGAVFKGLTIGTNANGTYLYAADFHNNQINVLPGTGAPALSGNFTDPNLPAGYAPFNIQNIGGILYVTYAQQDAAGHDDVPGAGHGFVDTYDLNGNFLGRLVSNGALDSPWGLAIAPVGFGDVAGDLLVGNFGDGQINVYNPTTGTFVETLVDAGGNPIVIDGLWALRFGNGAGSGPVTNLYFTAGTNGEADGLFGDLATVPEPGTWAMLGIGLGALFSFQRRLKTR